MNISFSGKVVLVAGGTGGLGRSVSLAFLREGATVVVTYRKNAEFAALQAAASSNASALEGHAVDMTDETATAALIAGVLSRHGRLDAVVNTIGGYAGGIKLWDLETRTLDTMLSLNLRSGFTLARAALPAMLRQGQGSIVNVAAKAAVDHGAGAAATLRRKPRLWRSWTHSPKIQREPASGSTPSSPASSIPRRIEAPCPAPTSQRGPGQRTLPKSSCCFCRATWPPPSTEHPFPYTETNNRSTPVEALKRELNLLEICRAR